MEQAALLSLVGGVMDAVVKHVVEAVKEQLLADGEFVLTLTEKVRRAGGDDGVLDLEGREFKRAVESIIGDLDDSFSYSQETEIKSMIEDKLEDFTPAVNVAQAIRDNRETREALAEFIENNVSFSTSVSTSVA